MKRQDLRLITPKFDNFLGDQLKTQLNWEDTCFLPNANSSLLDLVVTNALEKVKNIKTHPNPCGEHVILTWTINVNPDVFKEQFYAYRDFSLLNWENIEPLIALCEPLQELFQFTDPDEIASHLLLGYNSIIDTISPQSRRQIQKSRNRKEAQVNEKNHSESKIPIPHRCK